MPPLKYIFVNESSIQYQFLTIVRYLVVNSLLNKALICSHYWIYLIPWKEKMPFILIRVLKMPPSIVLVFCRFMHDISIKFDNGKWTTGLQLGRSQLIPVSIRQKMTFSLMTPSFWVQSSCGLTTINRRNHE